MTRTLRLMAVALAIAGMAGCKMNLTADLYSSDLRDAMGGATDLTAPATMAFQVPGTDECEKHTAEISEIMAGVVADFAPRGCESVEMEAFLLADTQIPLLSEPAWKESDSLFGIILVEGEEKDAIKAALLMNLEKYGILTSRMKDKFHQTVNLAESKVVISLNNDLRDPVSFSVEGAFVDGEPTLGKTTHELRRRHNAEIVLSNVATSYMAKHGIAGGIILRMQR